LFDRVRLVKVFLCFHEYHGPAREMQQENDKESDYWEADDLIRRRQSAIRAM
jgi:hypothetical protein